MKWIKRGLIFDKEHTQLPIVIKIDGELRIFYATRNLLNESEIHYIDVLEHNPKLIVRQGEVFKGSLDFDENGAMTSCIVNTGDKFYLYYTGWSKKSFFKYRQSIGVALSNDCFTFEKYSKPVIASALEDYFICCSPWVMVENNLWRMWFISGQNCEGWIGDTPIYTMHYAESQDGLTWKRKNIYFPRRERELFSRPFIIKEDKYKMWYSWMILNGPKKYHIGYAESEDGFTWERFDNENILETSSEGWDSQMVAFPYLYGDYMFYSGNYFGKGGLGYAIRA